MTTTAPPPLIEDLTRACLEYVRRAVGMELDFSVETLSVLDHYASLAREEIQKNRTLEPLIAPALGAYFGEVVRGRLDGFWRIPSANPHDFSVCSRVAFLSVNPIGVGYDALHAGTEHSGPRSTLRVAPEDSDYLNRRLASLPPVGESDFYSFTTRFEVLEVATEALTAKMQEEGYGGTEYSPEDYGLEYDA